MAIRTVGPTSTFPTIAAAMLAANAADTIVLEAGYSNETATVTHNGMTVSGQASSTGIILHLGTGIATFALGGSAPITVDDAPDGNSIVGNDGDNTIIVTNGVDAVTGGLGVDLLRVDYHTATGAITGNSTSNFTEAGGSGRAVSIVDGTFENFTVLTGSGADTLTVGDGDNTIKAGSGANTITAGQGANRIFGGDDADTITAGDGGNTIDSGDGANTLTSGAGNDRIYSGTGADTIVAGGGSDQVTVLGGADTVDSGAGSDRLIVLTLNSAASSPARAHCLMPCVRTFPCSATEIRRTAGSAANHAPRTDPPAPARPAPQGTTIWIGRRERPEPWIARGDQKASEIPAPIQCWVPSPEPSAAAGPSWMARAASRSRQAAPRDWSRTKSCAMRSSTDSPSTEPVASTRRYSADTSVPVGTRRMPRRPATYASSCASRAPTA